MHILTNNSEPGNRSAASPDLLAAALEYRVRGWSIIPVQGKKPAGLWKPFQALPADETTLRRQFAREGVTGLAVILGAVSGGLSVRDFDQADAYREWAAKNPSEAASLPSVQTARGYHVYGRLEEERFVEFGDGELRADSGHYVLLPPSRHPTGPTYAWLNPLPSASKALPPLPASLMVRWGEDTQQPMQPIACVPNKAVEDAIEATLPDGPGQRNRKIFDLARRLKAIAGLEMEMLGSIVTEWHRQALPVISTKEFAETWSDFQIAWRRVRKPHGTTVHAAFAAAGNAPRKCIDGDTNLGTLAVMCQILSNTSGGGQFFLSCRTVEVLFGVSRMAAWRWLEALQFHGIIESITKGTLKNRQATTWRFTGKEQHK